MILNKKKNAKINTSERQTGGAGADTLTWQTWARKTAAFMALSMFKCAFYACGKSYYKMSLLEIIMY